MRWFSNHESAARGEVSILAIIETLIAISISIGIAVYFDTTLHILISACIALFLLLRTEESTELGLKWFKSCCFGFYWGRRYFFRKAEDSDNLKVTIAFQSLYLFYTLILLFPLMALASVLIKFFATLITFIHKPITSLALIPHNWARVAFATDLASPPEIMTGVEISASYRVYIICFSDSIDLIKSNLSRGDFFWCFFCLPCATFIFRINPLSLLPKSHLHYLSAFYLAR